MRLYLKEPELQDKEKILEMCEEIKTQGNDFEGLNNFGDILSYEEWLKKVEDNKFQDRIKQEYSPQTTYIAINEIGKVVGGINIRHVLKGNLIHHGGNIGYLIRPSERNKGYGSKMLFLALEKCQELGLDKVLVTCRVDNLGSAKVIEHNYGMYENNYYDESMKKSYKRYWIDVNQVLLKENKKRKVK